MRDCKEMEAKKVVVAMRAVGVEGQD